MKLPRSIESFQFVSHRARMSQKFDSRKESHLKQFEQRPQILVKLSFRELCYSKLSGLHPFDNMATSLSQKVATTRKEDCDFMRH